MRFLVADDHLIVRMSLKLMWLVPCMDHQLPGQGASNRSRVQQAVDSVRLVLEKHLQNQVPSLNMLI